MCSSPKSSMASRSNKVPVKAFCETLNQGQRKRFADLANRADERRQQRLVAQARWQHKNKASNTSTHQSNIWTWFSDVMFGGSPR